MAIPVTARVVILDTTVSTGNKLEAEVRARPAAMGRVTETTSCVQDGSAVSPRLVGEPNLWSLQL